MTLALFGRTFNPKALTLLREEQGLSRTALGKKLDYHRGATKIAGYENGRYSPSPYGLQLLVRALGCTIDDLAPVDPNYKPNKNTHSHYGIGQSKTIHKFKPGWHWQD